jgi:pSer/pThr/pTyr-binding forkhead associated (FHA) protein
MVRAHPPGAPQRVSAHVVPKTAFAAEDEKTTVESGWEEEGSTTVEQGEVADRLKAYIPEAPRRTTTHVTSTTGVGVDEPTADDRRALSATGAAEPGGARLVVTRGNDAGRQLVISAAKSFTVGRGIENDMVLTDIAVSRKHFDLRPEGGAWLVIDRGSGNGTLVNGALEDRPFRLANGDLIEIGNTVFRFEQEGAHSPVATPIAGTHDLDDEERSTVAGTPIGAAGTPPRPAAASAGGRDGARGSRGRATPAAEPARAELPRAEAEPPPRATPRGPAVDPPRGRQPRAVTSPPPAPPPRIRPPAPPSPEPPPAPHPSAPSLGPVPAAARPAPTAPRSGHATGAPPAQGSQLLPATVLPMPQLPVRSSVPSLAQVLAPAVSIGSTPPGPLAAPAGRGGSGPPLSAPGLAKGPHQSTLQGPAPAPIAPFPYPTLAEMHKHAMLAAAQGSVRDATSTALVHPTPFGGASSARAASAPGALPLRTKLLLAGAGLTLLAAIGTIAVMKSTEATGALLPEPRRAVPEPTPQAPPLTASAPAAPSAPAAGSGAEAAIAAPPPRSPAPAIAPGSDRAAGSAAPPGVRTEQPAAVATEPAAVATAPAPAPAPTVDAPRGRREPAAATEPAPPSPSPAAVAPAAPPERAAAKELDRRDPPRRPPVRRDPPRRIADRADAATARDRADAATARDRARELYRAKRFGAAASLLRDAAAAASGSEASDLRSRAAVYDQLGAAYNRGMSPAATPIDAYKDLRTALGLDRTSAGGELITEILERLSQVAPKAAISYTVSNEYESAFAAVRIAEANGVSNGDTRVVRSKLEAIARDIYAEAAAEIEDNPEAAKQKLRRIRAMVDAKSPVFSRANALLAAH